MADNHFFDLLKKKMAEMRPSEKHREADWASLGERLNITLPQQPRQRRTIVLPLLLLMALLLSNAAWWQSSSEDKTALAMLEAQVADLQTPFATTPLATKKPAIHDTIWRTIYVQTPAIRIAKTVPTEQSIMAISGSSQAGRDASDKVNDLIRKDELVDKKITDNSHAANTIINAEQYKAVRDLSLAEAELIPLEHTDSAMFNVPESVLDTPESIQTSSPASGKPTKTFAAKFRGALRPKFFKVGANIGWLYANSVDLMHQGGFSCNLHSQIGFSRHWSMTFDVGMGSMHYKAHHPAAILGAPALTSPHSGFHLAEMDVTGQKFRQFGLGARYSFAQPGKLRPYLGLGWGGLTVLPYSVEYEITDEHTGTIQKDLFEVMAPTRLRNIFALNGGVQIPLAPRFDLTLEAHYQRQWKKPSSQAPDLTGIRAGLNWLF